MPYGSIKAPRRESIFDKYFFSLLDGVRFFSVLYKISFCLVAVLCVCLFLGIFFYIFGSNMLFFTNCSFLGY